MPTAPFTAERIRCEIKKLIAAVTERDPEEISDTASFKDDLGVDSLMAMEVMVSSTSYSISISLRRSSRRRTTSRKP
jgi:acyl carrier protein